jgi:Zn-finger nucleic acid-binding protein
MTSHQASCPSCSSPLVEIRLAGDVAMRSCSRCEQRWWRCGETDAPIGAVLDVVGAVSGRRRAA